MGSINSHFTKLFCIWKGYDLSRFTGLQDGDIFVAYKTYFNKFLVPFKPQATVLCGGIENLFTSLDNDVIFVGPKAIEILRLRPNRQRKSPKREYVAILHPVVKSQEFLQLTRITTVRQIFLQVLIPGHTCFLLFQDGCARLLDNKMNNFGWDPDILSHICAVIPWKVVLPPDSKQQLHLYTISFKPPIQKYCALTAMACIKYLVQNKDWERARRKLGIVPVIRNNSAKTLNCRKIFDSKVNDFYCNMVMECFFELIKVNVITRENFQ